MCQKPLEADDHCEILDRLGKPYKRIDASGKWRCNFLEDELKSGGDALSLTEFATVLGQGLKEAVAGDQNPFYKSFERRILFNAIAAVSMGDKLTFPNLHRFISGAVRPTSKDPQENARLRAEWEQGYHYQTMLRAKAARKTAAEVHNWNVIAPFWGREWQEADERTRGNGLSGGNNLMQSACTGLAMALTSMDSNAFPGDVEDGINLIIDLPYTTYQETGRFVGGGWLLKIQRHLLRRDWDGRYFCILVRDEFQASKSDWDAPFMAQCRSHGASMMVASQTSHSLYGTENEHKSDALMSNFYTNAYCQVDPDTEAQALKKLGQRLEPIPQPPGPADPWDVLNGNVQANVQFQYQPRLHAGALGNLRTGGPPHNTVDGLVIQGSPFRNGERFRFVSFKQPKRS